jgi:hypothetical protein
LLDLARVLVSLPQEMVRTLIAGTILIFFAAATFAQVPTVPVRPVDRVNELTVAALPTPGPVSVLPNQGEAPGLTITIEASRAQPTAGGSFSLSGVVKNVSTKPITLTGKGSTLFLPPEVAGSESVNLCTYWGYFSTEAGKDDFSSDTPVTIAGGDAYTIEWNTLAQPTGTAEPPIPSGVIQSIVEKIKSEMEFVFFSPGDYKATVTLRYHVDDDPPDSFRTMTQSAVVHVAAPQSVILFGAAVGGLLGYIITLLFLSKRHDAVTSSTQQLGGRALLIAVALCKFLAGAVGSILLSAIVTILLSRLSETQFLIRVSINDFWGAIAVGFVANLTGIKILQTISGGAQRPDGVTPQTSEAPETIPDGARRPNGVTPQTSEAR